MQRNLFIGMLAGLFVIGGVISFGHAKSDDAGILHASATDPLNATYMIEGQKIRLIDGRSETEAVPGSATKVITSVFGKPVYGNIDGEGAVDAALILTYDLGGSGTFYYAAATLNVNGNYRGTNAVLLGDRVAPQNVSVRNGLIVANYADRRPGEPMAATPSVGQSKHLILERNVLKETAPLTGGEQVVEGWVTIGHEARSFVPCLQKKELWLLGNSPALNEVMAAYRKALPGPMLYIPLFMTLAGKTVGPPSDGFGAEYEASFFAAQLVQVFPQGNCKSDLIYMDSPLPGALVASPLRIRGHARGKWFFEGDFPVVIKDTNGKAIAKGFATAKNGWMTETFVPFEGMIEFKGPGSGSKGTLVLKKDNPTDRPEFDNALEISVFFK
ncbi:MAG: Gmad2 immunoglobulin-like domain-containing protein [Thermodesulfobacteriota bacterium]|nr:Gmad2 immunoglobulin-like domain-containing protein [Thermodesulfobacteriota bacterium]